MNTVLRVIWTAAILGLVVFVSRSAPSGADVSADTVRCELNPPPDIAGLEACLARSPQNVELLLELGAAYVAVDRVADARELYRRAVAIDPRDAEVRQRLDGLRQ